MEKFLYCCPITSRPLQREPLAMINYFICRNLLTVRQCDQKQNLSVNLCYAHFRALLFTIYVIKA